MIRTRADAPERLARLEAEDRRLSVRMHRDQVRRATIQDEIRHLRVSLTQEQRERYEATKWLEEKT